MGSRPPLDNKDKGKDKRREEPPWAWEWNEPLAEGVRLFNAGEYFECHEVLEDLWRAEEGPLKDLYQGLIKAAVALYHAERGNFVGAARVLERGLPQLRPYARKYLRLDIESLVRELEGWRVLFRAWASEAPDAPPAPPTEALRREFPVLRQREREP